MGSNRFYEHAQNLLQGVKKEVGNKRPYGAKGMLLIIIQNKINYVVLIVLYYFLKYIMLSIFIN